MRFTKRWARVATAAGAGAIALGVGTVAAQSAGERWWHIIFEIGPLFGQSDQGEVTIGVDPVSQFEVMSGNLGRARQSFAATGEYIGCQVFTDPNDGQRIKCAARDRSGETLECETIYEPGNFQLRQHMLLNAALSLTDNHYVAVAVRPNGECASLQVLASSADFAAPTSQMSACTDSNSTDLGPWGGAAVSVPNNACVKITRFAKPNWTWTPDRRLQLQNPTGNVYPVTLEYRQACTNKQGTGRFDHNYDDQYLGPGLSDTCTLFIKLGGTGNGNISLRYW